MGKKKNERELHYKDIITKQKRKIQDLTKKVGRASKLEERYYKEPEEVEETYSSPKQQTYGCPKCNGQLDIIGGEKIKIFICQDCNYRASSRVNK